MHAIGIDIGYGYTKALASSGEQVFFASAVGAAEEIDYQVFECAAERPEVDSRARSDGGIVSIDGRDYFYGALALQQSRYLLQARERNWTGSVPYRALLHAIISRLLPQSCNTLVSIVTGLPVAYYPDREQLSSMLASVIEPAAPWLAIKVIPQPFGTFFDYILDQDGELANREEVLHRIGIIDIGYYTTDLVEVNNLEYIARGSSTIELGVSSILDEICRWSHSRYNRRLDLEEAEEALKKRIVMVHNRTEDVSQLVDRAIEAAAGALKAEAHRLWREGTSLERILLTGGGSSLFYRTLQNAFPGATPVMAPQWANVRGYMKYAIRLGKKEETMRALS